MINDKGSIRCDAEIGSPARGWHTCGKPAVCQSVTTRYSISVHLDWCKNHRSRGTIPGRNIVKEYK